MARPSPAAAALAAALLVACGEAAERTPTEATPAPGSASPGAPSPGAAAPAEAADVEVRTLARGLQQPWALEFLPDGRMLVTERPGRLRYVDAKGALSEPIAGVPEVHAAGQGGLLDVALDPDFSENRTIYLSFAEAGAGGAGTAVARGRLDGNRLTGVRVVWRQQPKVQGPNHFGSRLVFGRDGDLFVTLGERFQFEPAQDSSNTLGAIVRIDPQGGVPADNPFAGRQDARPEIWSYGHRNIEAAALHPETGRLWVAEMGPEGGDELNIPEPGRNYGWPAVSWGRHYDGGRFNGADIPDPPTRADLAGSIRSWTPVISPSGFEFYSGDLFPGWNGNALIGGLSSEGLVRLTIREEEVVSEARIPLGRRIRDVKQGPDGAVYVVTGEDDGELLRLTPR